MTKIWSEKRGPDPHWKPSQIKKSEKNPSSPKSTGVRWWVLRMSTNPYRIEKNTYQRVVWHKKIFLQRTSGTYSWFCSESKFWRKFASFSKVYKMCHMCANQKIFEKTLDIHHIYLHLIFIWPEPVSGRYRNSGSQKVPQFPTLKKNSILFTLFISLPDYCAALKDVNKLKSLVLRIWWKRRGGYF